MKSKFTPLILTLFLFAIAPANSQVSSLTETFDAVTPVTGSAAGTPTAGWTAKNNSDPVGTTGWFLPPSEITPYIGAGCIAANYNNVTGANIISNWLISPVLNLANGATLSFWTRTVAAPAYPDRMEVRLSIAGASVNVGTTNGSVGDFITTLRTINDGLTTSGYPNTWTQINITLSGLTGTPTGRVAFRYNLPDGGPTGVNSDMIGIDEFVYSLNAPVKLVDFYASVNEKNSVSLNWKTAEEINSSYFNVQRSIDGENFSDIYKVESIGNSSVSHSYSHIDNNLSSLKTSMVYYRLKMVDIDGKFAFSKTIAAKLNKVNSSSIEVANFNGNTLNIKYNASVRERTQLSVFNSVGKLVASHSVMPEIGLNNFNTTQNFAGGIYYIHLTNRTSTEVSKVFK